MTPSAYTLRARYVFPVGSEPIEHGSVTVEGGRIAAVERDLTESALVHNLGDVALLPGPINAHTHLGLSDFDRPLGGPGIRLADWIPRLMAHGSSRPGPVPETIARGLHESLVAGSTALVDIALPGWSTGPFERCPIRTAVFQELIAPTPDRVQPAVELARRHLDNHSGAHYHLGLSPHAPYTVRPELLSATIDMSVGAGVPVAMHLAESLEEIELVATGGGPLREMLETLGAWSPGLIPVPAQPIDYLRKLAAAPRTLVIHGNYLNAAEWAFLAERRERMSVVYCPRSHAHFGHAAYPLGRMLAAGVHVCLGTDSRASSPNLSVLEEMRFAAVRHPNVPPAKLVELGTLAAARALGRDAELGSLQPGKQADLVAVALPHESASTDPYAMLLADNGPVVASWIGGERFSR